MKILQLRSEFGDNGPGTQSLSIGRELRRRGHQVVFAGGSGPLRPVIEKENFEFIELTGFYVRERGPVSTCRNVWRIARLLQQHRIDVVHAHNAAATYIAYAAAKLVGRRVALVHSVRGVELRRGYGWRNWIYRAYPAQMLAVCDFTRQTLIAIGANPQRITITYNGVDLERFDPSRVTGERIRREFALEERIVVGNIGAINGAKGQQVLVEAVALLRSKYPRLTALLVGDGPARASVEARVEELGLRHHVVFAGMRFESPDFHAAFDIYSQPSTWGEMFPNSILEAMAMGKPWVGSEISGLPELTAGGQAGRVSPPGDAKALAANLEELVANEDCRRRRGERARREVLERFTIEAVVDRIEGVYDRALADRGLTRAA